MGYFVKVVPSPLHMLSQYMKPYEFQKSMLVVFDKNKVREI